MFLLISASEFQGAKKEVYWSLVASVIITEVSDKIGKYGRSEFQKIQLNVSTNIMLASTYFHIFYFERKRIFWVAWTPTGGQQEMIKWGRDWSVVMVEEDAQGFTRRLGQPWTDVDTGKNSFNNFTAAYSCVPCLSCVLRHVSVLCLSLMSLLSLQSIKNKQKKSQLFLRYVRFFAKW